MTIGRHYLLICHDPVPEPDFNKWAISLGNTDRRVKLTVQGDVKVSTVFLGVDHSVGGGPPVLFETMVFRAGDSVDCQRYSTWDEAEIGHDEIVRSIFTAAPT